VIAEKLGSSSGLLPVYPTLATVLHRYSFTAVGADHGPGNATVGQESCR
jgi:hypothetical protein